MLAITSPFPPPLPLQLTSLVSSPFQLTLLTYVAVYVGTYGKHDRFILSTVVSYVSRCNHII